MDSEIAFFILLGLVIIAGPWVLGIVAMSRAGRAQREVARLKTQLANLQSPSTGADETPTFSQRDAIAADDSSPEEVISKEQPQPDVSDDYVPAPPPLDGEQVASTPVNEEPRSSGGFGRWVEEELTARWFVWLGGLALAMAGYFLVKYAAEQGLLGPSARVTGGIILGICLAAAGEWLRRRPSQREIASRTQDYVPQALVAAGLSALFASIYAAFGLYQLIGPLPAFALLAVISLGAFGLSVLQGPFVAVLGLLGGMATPLLIQTGSSFAPGLFSYLSLIIVASAAVMWFRPWWWLGLASILAGTGWILLWLAFETKPGDAFILIAFAGLMAGCFVSFAGYRNSQDTGPLWAISFPPENKFDLVAWIAAILGGFVTVLSIIADDFSNLALVAGAIFAGGLVVAAWWRERFDLLIAWCGILLGLTFAAWAHRASVAVWAENWRGGGVLAPAETPHDVWRMMRAALTVSVASLVTGYWLFRNRLRPALWSGVSVLIPIVMLLITYRRLGDQVSDMTWGVTALALAAVALAIAGQLIKSSVEERFKLSLGLYAAAVVAGVSLAFAFILREAWLTIALAVQLPALGWISNRLQLKQLRPIAEVIAIIVFVRLLLNPVVFDYESRHLLGAHWVLYGFGIPALAFHFALVQFRQHADDRLVSMLEAGRIVFAVLLVSAEIRVLVAGSLASHRFTLLETSLHAISWLAAAASRWISFARAGRIMDKWVATILSGAGIVMVFGGNLFFANPVLTGDSVGTWPIFNALLLGFAAPAVLLMINLKLTTFDIGRWARITVSLGALLLLFVWVTYETKFWFQGSWLDFGAETDAESYAYSAVWLLFSFTLLAAGIFFKRAELRHAALLVLVVTVVKVFLFDMGDLEGLLRVASFLGLGLALVAIGFVYQRLVFPLSAKPQRTE